MTDFPELKLFLSESDATLTLLGEWGYRHVGMVSLWQPGEPVANAARTREAYYALHDRFGATLFGGTTGIVMLLRSERPGLEDTLRGLSDLYLVGDPQQARFVSPSGEAAVSPLALTRSGITAWANHLLPEWDYRGVYPMDPTYLRHRS